MPQVDNLSKFVDRVMREETERFVGEVPYASHLTDGQELDENYYIRHRVETVRRIRLTARTDALALARMVDDDYSAARKWSRYVTDELGHDVLFLRDLARHHVPEQAVIDGRPFAATLAMVQFIDGEIKKVGPLAAVAYSLVVEWSSMQFSPRTVEKAQETFSAEHVAGSKVHLGIDEDEDHYKMMLEVVSRILEKAGGIVVLERLMRMLCAYFRQYFTELHDATVLSARPRPQLDVRPAVPPWVSRHRNESIDWELLPSDDDVVFYQEHGWYISPRILPADLLDRALDDCWRFVTGERDVALPGEPPPWRDVEGLRFKMPYVSLQMNNARELVQSPMVGAIAARLARTPVVRLFRDAVACKPPGARRLGTRVGWHTDRAYWPTCTSDDMLTAWIPFAACDETRGTLMVLDGSHHWPNNLGRTLHEQDMEGTLAGLATGGKPVIEVPMVLQRGQISFHHCRTVHASRENSSSDARVSLVVHLQDAANQYRPRSNSAGQPVAHLNDFLCRKLPTGLPDYADPQVCPVLWGEEHALHAV
jgi:phytanoyl-CoA dioxygenase PhyH